MISNTGISLLVQQPAEGRADSVHAARSSNLSMSRQVTLVDTGRGVW